MKTIEAIFEHGHLKPLERLPLVEHQHVWVTIQARPDDLPALGIASLGAGNPAFDFLADPAEDVYTLEDGEPL